jgi:hypothetical protein
MHSFRRVLLSVFTLAALFLPAVVALAQDTPPFFASTTGLEDGDGSADSIRMAQDAEELAYVCEQEFGPRFNGPGTATVYWIVTAGNNTVYFTYNMDVEGNCTITGTVRPGLPPELGVELTPPLIIGGLVALGLLLVGVAWLLRRRLRTGAQPT